MDNVDMFRGCSMQQLPYDEERDLIARGQNNPPDQDAKVRVIATVYPYIVKIASQYARFGGKLRRADKDEYELEAIYYLLKRFNDFQLSKGTRYITMAASWIRSAVQRAYFHKGTSSFAGYRDGTSKTRVENLDSKIQASLADTTRESEVGFLLFKAEHHDKFKQMVSEFSKSLPSPLHQRILQRIVDEDNRCSAAKRHRFAATIARELGCSRQHVNQAFSIIRQRLILWVLKNDDSFSYDVLEADEESLTASFMASKPSVMMLTRLNRILERNMNDGKRKRKRRPA